MLKEFSIGNVNLNEFGTLEKEKMSLINYIRSKERGGLLYSYIDTNRGFIVYYEYENGLMVEVNIKSKSPISEINKELFYNPFIYSICYESYMDFMDDDGYYAMTIELEPNFKYESEDNITYNENSDMVIVDTTDGRKITLMYNSYGILSSVRNLNGNDKVFMFTTFDKIYHSDNKIIDPIGRTFYKEYREEFFTEKEQVKVYNIYSNNFDINTPYKLTTYYPKNIDKSARYIDSKVLFTDSEGKIIYKSITVNNIKKDNENEADATITSYYSTGKENIYNKVIKELYEEKNNENDKDNDRFILFKSDEIISMDENLTETILHSTKYAYEYHFDSAGCISRTIINITDENNEKKIAKEYYYNISGLRNNRPYCVEDLENNIETHYQNFIDDEDTYEPVFSIVKCVGKLPEKFFE